MIWVGFGPEGPAPAATTKIFFHPAKSGYCSFRCHDRNQFNVFFWNPRVFRKQVLRVIFSIDAKNWKFHKIWTVFFGAPKTLSLFPALTAIPAWEYLDACLLSRPPIPSFLFCSYFSLFLPEGRFARGDFNSAYMGCA